MIRLGRNHDRAARTWDLLSRKCVPLFQTVLLATMRKIQSLRLRLRPWATIDSVVEANVRAQPVGGGFSLDLFTNVGWKHHSMLVRPIQS
jgi:hypothetical protein